MAKKKQNMAQATVLVDQVEKMVSGRVRKATVVQNTAELLEKVKQGYKGDKDASSKIESLEDKVKDRDAKIKKLKEQLSESEMNSENLSVEVSQLKKEIAELTADKPAEASEEPSGDSE